MKKIKNIFCVILAVIIISIFVQSNVYATGAAGYRSALGSEQVFDSASDPSTSNGKVTSVLNAVISIVRIAGMCIAITMLLVVAIKYMSAAPGEKADIKKASIAYVVGALVLFGAVGILGIISSFATTNIKVSPTAATPDEP